MSYVIAAYTVVLGALVIYGARLHLRRRALRRAAEASESDARGRE